MSTLTVTQLATLPRVNLLPPEIEEARRLKRTQAGLGVAVLAVAGVVGAMTMLASSAVSDAEAELQTEKARATTLRAEQAQYAEVPLVYAQVEAANTQLAQAMGNEVRWSHFLNDISLRMPSKVWLTSMTVTQNVDAAPAVAGAPSTGSYLDPGIGTVTFIGQGLKHNDVAAWLDALAKQRGLTQPYFSNSTKGEIAGQTVVQFTSTATLTPEALSERYTQTKAGS